MYVATSAEMRELDRYAVETIGIPVASLMENAGWETARTAEAFLQKKLRSRTVSGDRAFSWIILVGKGHNGGDGLVAARRLAEAGHRVRIVLAEPPDRMEPETVRQWEIAWRLGIRTDLYSPGANHLSDCDALLDALLGTGVRGAPREPYASLIREANASGRPIVAVDVPSGLDADTGRPYDPCIRAELTVTFALPKSGLVQDPALAFVGRVVVRPIGIDPRWAEAIGVRAMLLGPDAWRRLDIDAERPLRPDTHKGAQGHVLIVGGSRGMAGAGLLCARAALRAGCGLVTWAIPDRLVESMAGRAPEIMLAGVADGGRGDWSAVRPDDVVTLAASRDAVAVGPGLGRFPGGERLIRALWENTDKPLVIDADALNLIASVGDFADWPRRSGPPAVLTPHPGEMARLCGVTAADVSIDRIGYARRFAEKHGVVVALKGARTVVAAPDGFAYINTTGNPGMATAGSGDVLTGVVAGLLAQGYTPLQAAALGVYLHGKAGDRAARYHPSLHSVTSVDILESL
ncbi:MAG: bifunctional ADP-dependent (S)-NAD(P)H-hydrate dehydratase/NAD(P)H-hydrate epimerase [Candidatus Reconcilbacillus cellulovorans]|uniref:Bifunctional NAD(P)H-hydrate repair enzyme n=1 Tax=Candidatus Reconcilbacillus cellulovorans TaxID=1906605 RepID=A0A2A6DZ57_9BACL|nr:MAG: bifunctional ADP-dependent (S)-NAD(P)H-hydrate dehydratase/NAD(P)H-hydrate epimerase [Candidatus Reconcilbacillus cellulovorans]